LNARINSFLPAALIAAILFGLGATMPLAVSFH
jgi:hypothetical protein